MDEDLEDLSVSQLMHLDPEAPLVIDGAKPGAKVSYTFQKGTLDLFPICISLARTALSRQW